MTAAQRHEEIRKRLEASPEQRAAELRSVRAKIGAETRSKNRSPKRKHKRKLSISPTYGVEINPITPRARLSRLRRQKRYRDLKAKTLRAAQREARRLEREARAKKWEIELQRRAAVKAQRLAEHKPSASEKRAVRVLAVLLSACCAECRPKLLDTFKRYAEGKQ